MSLAAVSPEEFAEAKRAVFEVDVKPDLIRYSVMLIRQTRRDDSKLEVGCSPRAGISLLQAARARAFLHGRDYVTLTDLEHLTEDVMLHRVRRSYQAVAQGISARTLLPTISVAEVVLDGHSSGA